MKLWNAWISETTAAINRYARWVFATLVLSFLVFANVATILLVLFLTKKLVVSL